VFSEAQLEVLLKQKGLSQRLKVLMLLASMDGPSKPSEITHKGVGLGLRAIKNWNVPQILKNADNAGEATRVAAGWKMLPAGVDALNKAGLPTAQPKPTLVANTLHDLKKHVDALTEPDRQRFMQEALECFENDLNRAAVVFSWVGAVWILQNYIVTNELRAFNAAGRVRFGSDYKAIKNMKTFARMKESDFLQLCEDAGVLDKTEKNQLAARLDLRNACGHPNNFVVEQLTAASHIEILLLNVYEKY
jgi:hypothetical protein